MWLVWALLVMVGSILIGAAFTHFQNKPSDRPGELIIEVKESEQ